MPARSISSQPLPTFSPKRETGLMRERIHKAVMYLKISVVSMCPQHVPVMVYGNNKSRPRTLKYLPRPAPEAV